MSDTSAATADFNPEVEELRKLLGAALERIERLEARSAEPDPSLTAPVTLPWPIAQTEQGLLGAAPEAADVRLDRRRAMQGAVLAAGAAAAGMVLGDAKPAAAANGSALILGSGTQGCTAGTSFAVTGTGAGLGLSVVDNSRATYNTNPALAGHAKGSNFNVGVEGKGEGISVGLYAETEDGVGVQVVSNGGVGVDVVTYETYGVRATSPFIGVQGTGNHAGSEGVVGLATSGNGVRGQSTGGVGVKGVSSSSGGVLGQSNSNVGVSGTSVTGVGMAAESGFLALAARSTDGGGIDVRAPKFHLRMANDLTRNAPTSDAFAHDAGEIVQTSARDTWVCVVSGTPGTWRKISGPAAAGAFHVLPAPARIYDSRAGTAPAQGPKTQLSGNVARVLDCTANSSGVPLGATAVSVTILLVNASNGNGNMTLWANGAARPAANTMVWGAGSGRYTSSTICALDTAAKLQASASAATDVVLDIVGYYR